MKQTEHKTLLVVLSAVVILGILLNCLFFALVNNNDVPTADEIADKIVIPVQNMSDLNEKIEYLYNLETEDDRAEDIAEELVLSEIELKSFKKELLEILENETDLDSYKDIYKIKVKDLDVDLSGESAEVEIELKVYYYIDGDEEEKERALFTVIFEVIDLDEDDDFEDAEATLDELELLKIYE